MKILLVGGNFDYDGGKKSSLVEKFHYELSKLNKESVKLYNGGNFNDIETILQSCINYDCVFWWPNIPNDYAKNRDIKSINYKTLLVNSKRNDNEKYTFAELVNKSLEEKANLTIEFKKIEDKYQFMLFDPLGTMWYKGFDINQCCQNLYERLEFLHHITRNKSIEINDKKIEIPNNIEFFDFVKKSAEIFHNLINPSKEVTRFLGNSSFRCQKGFPSFRDEKYIYVSRRNIDKRYISKDNFVATYLDNDVVYYFGENKPSVDTPIQLRLYNKFQKVNFMIHAHCYCRGGTFTKTPVPCGAIEEVNEILNAVNSDTNKDFYKINLIGHGCLIMSDNVKKMKKVKFLSRSCPENITLITK